MTKRLERHLAVNQRGDDVAGARLHAMLDNGNVAIHDAFADHRIPAHFQAEGAGGRFDAERLHVNQHAALLLLRGVLGQAGGDGAVNRHGHHPRPKPAFGRVGIHHLERPGATSQAFQESLAAQGLHVRQRRVRAAEAEMRGDLAEGGGEPLRVLFALDETPESAAVVRSVRSYWTNVQYGC